MSTPSSRAEVEQRIADLEQANMALQEDNQSMRTRLDDAEQTLAAIREGQVDALVVDTPEGERIFSLQGAERPYRALVEQMQEGAATLGQDGTIQYCNRAFADMLKRPLEAVLGSCVVRHVDEPDRPAMAALLRQCQCGSTHGEICLCAADGGIVPAQVSLTLVVDNGEVSICMVATDLTERKRAEKILASEQHYRVLFECNPDGVFAVDKTGRFILANRACEQIVGYSVPELLHRTFMELCAPDRMDETVAQLQRGLTERLYLELETALIHKDGTRVEVWLAGEPVVENGVLVATHCTAKDITARKRAENAVAAAHRQIQSLIDNASAIVYAFDLEARFVLANTAVARLLGSTPEQMIGKRRREFMPKDDADWHEANDRKVIETGTAMEFEEQSQLEGRSITWLTTKFPLRDTQGRIYAVAGMSADITERKRGEEVLKVAKAALEQANAAKDQFIAKLSHELRTPLTPVVAALSALARDERLPEDLQEDMRLLERNIGLEVSLINDLLDVTRIVNRKLEVRREPVDVAAVLHEAGRIVASDLDAKNQTLTIDTPGSPYWVDADRARLNQVFWNLIKNAIKFSPERARITVDAASVGGLVRIVVKDPGQGIDPSDLPRLFGAFEQGAAQPSFGGLGLGLAVCKGIVDLHGGSITAASEGKGKGAAFTVELPRLAGSPQLAPTAPAGQPLMAARSLCILLVEDNADTARVMARLLKSEGHKVTWAACVKDALATARSGSFDVLLSDIGLPDGTGYDVMRQLIAAGNQLRGIAVSGYGAPEDIERALAAGFVEHVTKPVSFDALYNALVRAANAGQRA